MKSLLEYINENFDNLLKLSKHDKDLLLQLDLEYHALKEEYSLEQVHFMNVTNSKDEIDRIEILINADKDFDIRLKYEKSKFKDDEWCKSLSDRLGKLSNKFNSINSFITKYYKGEISAMLHKIEFLNAYEKDGTIKPEYDNLPPQYVYDEAIKILRETKYDNRENLPKEYDRVFTPEESQKRLQKVIDKEGFGWKVIIDDNMIPRMSVRPYKQFRISSKCKFSEVDLQSLEIHEIKVHTARKYWGLQSGLFLFMYGLPGSNIINEGIAIYNSLHKLEHPKPNILFYIAIKIVTRCKLAECSPLETFKFLKSLTNASDRVLIYNMIRCSRVNGYNLMFSGSSDMHYLEGYMLVKDMSDKERDELIKYPIGPSQLFELETIKKFLSINKFKPLKYERSENEDNKEIY